VIRIGEWLTVRSLSPRIPRRGPKQAQEAAVCFFSTAVRFWTSVSGFSSNRQHKEAPSGRQCRNNAVTVAMPFTIETENCGLDRIQHLNV
jgi:hypothetical protein